MQRIAIVDPVESSRESLRTMLLGVDFVWLEAECTRYEYFFDVIKQSMPDLVLVNLDGDKVKSLQMVSHVASQYPNLPIITTSSDSSTLLQSLQRGAKFFVSPPISLEDLVATLRRALNDNSNYSVSINPTQQINAARQQPAQIIAVLGSRGGVGCTTVAVNLAASLAADINNSVGLVDLDMALGDVDVAIELANKDHISIADLARNIERLDMNYLKRAMIHHAETNIHVLRHPEEMAEISGIHEGHIERVLNLLKISYSHLIVDLSKAMLPTDIQVLRMADTILLMTQLELSSLRNVIRILHSLKEAPEILDKVRVVCNRVGSDHVDGGITIQKAEEVIGQPIYWRIPNDAKAVLSSRVTGMPLIRSAPKSKVHQSFMDQAQVFSGKTAAGEVKKRGWFGK